MQRCSHPLVILSEAVAALGPGQVAPQRAPTEFDGTTTAKLNLSDLDILGQLVQTAAAPGQGRLDSICGAASDRANSPQHDLNPVQSIEHR
jgi:hypothetical protein